MDNVIIDEVKEEVVVDVIEHEVEGEDEEQSSFGLGKGNRVTMSPVYKPASSSSSSSSNAAIAFKSNSIGLERGLEIEVVNKVALLFPQVMLVW